MPFPPDQFSFETANNRKADPYAGGANPRPEPKPVQEATVAGEVYAPGEQIPATDLKTDDEMLNIARQARTAAEKHLGRVASIWANAYRAYNNMHVKNSKYEDDRWRGRTKHHTPKTRSAVHKADAGAANALFANSDVVNTGAVNPSDPKQLASAAIISELLSYRLDRASDKAGMPWFQVAVGAHNDARLTALCISKQNWDFHRTKKGRVKRDRPLVTLYPPEMVLRDPTANWVNQAESASYIGLLNPMSVDDAKALMKQGGPDSKSRIKWRDPESIPTSAFQSSTMSGSANTQSTQTAREQSTNSSQRYDDKTGYTGFDICWMVEWFVRLEDEEYVFWTIGTEAVASELQPVEEAYPAFKGDRPIVIGYGSLEPHKIDPMSAVQAGLPLQSEINDIRNLYIDGVKETVRPLVQARRGVNIDAKAVQNRSGDTIVWVNDPQTDLSFDRPGQVGQDAPVLIRELGIEFDDVAGQFNNSSVQNNQALNKTLGGLKLVNANANIVGDFDLRIFIETWVEPVLRQVVKLLQYFEDDKVILSIAGAKAKLFQKFGVDTITDELLEREVTVTVAAGIGTADPNVKMEKFAKAAAITTQLTGPEVMLRAKQDAVIAEVFGAAGFKDAVERFFHEGDQQDGRIVKMKEALAKVAKELDDKKADHANKIDVGQLGAAEAIILKVLEAVIGEETAAASHEREMESMGYQHGHDTKKMQEQGRQKMDQMRAKGPPGGPGNGATPPEGRPAPRMPMNAQRPQQASQPQPPQQRPALEEGSDMSLAQSPVLAALITALAPKLVQKPGMPGGAGGPPKPEPAQMAQMQGQQQMMAMMKQIADGQAQLAQAMQKLVQAQTMPKRVQRDASGRVIGVAPALPEEGPPALPPPGPGGPAMGGAPMPQKPMMG